MASTEERLQILKMIENGKITSEEGKRLLDALKQQDATRPAPPSSARWLRVRVTNRRSGEDRINFNMPIRLVDMGLRMAARFVPEMQVDELEDLREMLRSGVQGKIFEMDDQESNEHVEIFVE